MDYHIYGTWAILQFYYDSLLILQPYNEEAMLGASTVWVQPTCLPLLSKLIYELVFSGPQSLLFGLMQSWACMGRTDFSWWGVMQGGWDTLKKKAKAIRPWVRRAGTESWSTESNSAIVRKKQARASGGAVRKDREKHRESVREWKRKRDIFLCSSYIQGR